MSETTDLTNLIVKHRPGVMNPRQLARKLVVAARKLHRSYEISCNRSQTESELTIEAELESFMRVTCKAMAVDVKFNGDPRGFPVKLHFGPTPESQPGNTWGGAEDGYGIGESASR